MSRTAKAAIQADGILGDYRAAEALFDQVADTVYFLKDKSGYYLSVNQSLVDRCGCQTKADLIGKRASEIFPAGMGALISEQDDHVVASGNGIRSKLEMHICADGREGWCLTWKEPLRSGSGIIVGLSGISRDLRLDGAQQSDLAQVSKALDHIQDNFNQPLRVSDLAERASLSNYQLERRMQALLGLTIGQHITRTRISFACERLRRSNAPISAVAIESGYADQAAFSRQFKHSVGLTPSQYRRKSETNTRE